MQSKNIFMCFILIGLILISACTQQQIQDTTGNMIAIGKNILDGTKNFLSNESTRQQTKINLAASIADFIKQANLNQIDLKKVQTYEDYINMIDNINLLIKIVNEKTGTNIKLLSKEIQAYDKFMLEVNRYSPLLENYNSLVYNSHKFDRTNEESTNLVLTKTAGFTVEAMLIFGGVFYESAFFITGKLAEAFGLTKLASLCGPCVSAVMSTTHWTIRNGMIIKSSELAENITNKVS